MRNFVLACALLPLSACTTIHFDNGDTGGGVANSPEWHHNFALALYEASSPVILSEACEGGRWSSVKTETSFLNGLAGGAVNSLGPIWYPKSTQVTCE